MQEPKVIDNSNWQIPLCCSELWDICPHGVKRDKKRKKKNIGL